MRDRRDILIYFSLKYNGDWNNIYKALRRREEVDWSIYESFPEELRKKCITIFDEGIYPERLSKIYHPPFVLYYRGDISLISDTNKNVALVGSREASEYGLDATRMVADALSVKNILVSGMAIGIDSCAHRQVIESGGKTIGVLPCCISECYPYSSRDIYKIMSKHHLIISEYPFPFEIVPAKLPSRNRIIVGISKAVIVPEARERSGTLITIDLALMNGITVYCIPHPYNDGTINNHLIYEGAELIETKEEIIELLGNY